jgi:hypothetical protein
MHVHFFCSVHERLFDGIAANLRDLYGVERFSAFVWGADQQQILAERGIAYEPLVVFSRDILPRASTTPDLAYLEAVEAKYGVPINTVIFAERHLLSGRSFDEILGLVEVTFRVIEETLSRVRPDCIVTEDVSCLTSYVYWAVARGLGIPFHSIGQGKLPRHIAVYSNPMQ